MILLVSSLTPIQRECTSHNFVRFAYLYRSFRAVFDHLELASAALISARPHTVRSSVHRKSRDKIFTSPSGLDASHVCVALGSSTC